MPTLSFKHRCAFQFENVMITKPRRVSFRWNTSVEVRHNYLHNQIEFIIFVCVCLPTEQFWQHSNHVQIPDFSAAVYSWIYHFQLYWQREMLLQVQSHAVREQNQGSSDSWLRSVKEVSLSEVFSNLHSGPKAVHDVSQNISRMTQTCLCAEKGLVFPTEIIPEVLGTGCSQSASRSQICHGVCSFFSLSVCPSTRKGVFVSRTVFFTPR